MKQVPLIPDKIMQLGEKLRAGLRIPTVRAFLLALALALFAGGAWYSFRQLSISPSELEFGSLAILALLTLPSLLYGGIGLNLLARANRLEMPVGKATVIGAYAFLAELLPLPGGAIVRTGALIQAGGGIKQSSALVILTAVMWIALGMIGAGVALLPIGLHLSLPLLLAGVSAGTVIFLWLWRTTGKTIAIQTLVHRASGIALIALRLQFAFAALQVTTGFTQALPIVLASLVGSASSIAPAGLGIGESLAALVATTTDIPPGAAFLAVGIDRLICLFACLCTIGIDRIMRRVKASRGNELTGTS